MDRLRRQFARAMKGFELTAIHDAAMPVAQLLVTVMVQKKTALGILDEFVLRMVSAGIDTPEGIAIQLGLDVQRIRHAVTNLLLERRLWRTMIDDRLALTSRGEELARALAGSRPSVRPMTAVFDRILGGITDGRASDLLDDKQIAQRGLLRLAPLKDGRVVSSDVRHTDLDRCSSSPRPHILEVLSVQMIRDAHRAVQLLVFVDARKRVEFRLCVGGALLDGHNLVLDTSTLVRRTLADLGPARVLTDPGIYT